MRSRIVGSAKMVRPLGVECEGAYYHEMNRGSVLSFSADAADLSR